MPARIVTADERLAAANNKTSLAIFGMPGVGKTSLLKTLSPDQTVCLDLEAGMKSVQDWPGASIPIRSFVDFRDLAVLIGGPDPAADPVHRGEQEPHQEPAPLELRHVGQRSLGVLAVNENDDEANERDQEEDLETAPQELRREDAGSHAALESNEGERQEARGKRGEAQNGPLPRLLPLASSL